MHPGSCIWLSVFLYRDFVSLHSHICLRVWTCVSAFSHMAKSTDMYLDICICLWASVCVWTWPVHGFACASVLSSFWDSVRGCCYMYRSAHLWRSVAPRDFRHCEVCAWQAKDEIWCWRMGRQALCSDSFWLNNYVLQKWGLPCLPGPLLAASTSSRPPRSPLSPFFTGPNEWRVVSKGELGL